MNDIAQWSAIIAGTVIGKLYDPISWLTITIAGTIGYSRMTAWSVPAIALIATGANIALSYSLRKELGILDQWESRSTRLLIAITIITACGFFAGRAVSNLSGRTTPSSKHKASVDQRLKEHMKLVAENYKSLTYVRGFIEPEHAEMISKYLHVINKTWRPGTLLSEEHFVLLTRINKALRSAYDESPARAFGMKSFDEEFKPLVGWEEYYSQHLKD